MNRWGNDPYDDDEESYDDAPAESASEPTQVETKSAATKVRELVRMEEGARANEASLVNGHRNGNNGHAGHRRDAQPPPDDDVPPPRDEDAPPDVGEGTGTATEPPPPPPPRDEDAGRATGAAPRQAARRAIDILPDLVAEARLPMISTGFGRLDELLGGGLAARTMTQIIGPTGSGKTALAAQVVTTHARSAPALVYSGELTAAQFVARVIAQRTGRSWRSVLRLDLDEPTMRGVLADLNLYILSRSDTPFLDIAAAVTELMARGSGLLLLAIDYAQLIADVGENMRLAVMQSVRTLHRLTESIDIVTLLLAQGSRASSRAMREAGGSAEDYVDAGAETAHLEQASANVIALLGSRPDGAPEWDVTAAVAKSRYGRPGRVGLHFAGASGAWSELQELPTTEVEQARDLEIETSVRSHPPDCERCGGKPLSISALTDKARHKVAGNKSQITASVRRLERSGRVRNEGGALLAAGASQ